MRRAVRCLLEPHPDHTGRARAARAQLVWEGFLIRRWTSCVAGAALRMRDISITHTLLRGPINYASQYRLTALLCSGC